MDVYFPKDPVTLPLPLVVYIHGGQLIMGDKAAGIGPGSLFAPGAYTAVPYVAASINYRLGPDNKFPTMIEDAKCAIRHLRAKAQSYGLDPNRFGVIGTSSGGYLAALIGVTDASAQYEGTGGFAGVSSRVQAVVDEFGPVDLVTPALSPKISLAAAYPANSSTEFLKKATAKTHASADDPPFLIFHGDHDPAVPNQVSQDLNAALKSAGVASTFVLVKNGGHGFTATDSIYGTLAPTQQQIIGQEIAFFNKYLK